MTAGPTRNNNNNSPPSDSPAHHSLDETRDPGDVTPDQSARARPSPAGKKPRKAPSAVCGRAPRLFPGHGETVNAAGQPRREKLPVSAASSPVSPTTTTSSRKQASLSTMSTSLTDVAAKSALGGGSPEPARRKATATSSSRLAVPRASGRPPKTARPASDGGGTTTSYRGLASRLPSAATGSVGAIGDGGAKTAAVMSMSSFHPATHKQHQQQQQSPKSDDRPAGPASPSSSEQHVQSELGHDAWPDVSTDLLSSVASDAALSATLATPNNTSYLPAGQDDCHDRQLDRQSLLEHTRLAVSDEHENYQSFVDGLYSSVSDWQTDRQSVASGRMEDSALSDADREHQNAASDHKPQQCLFDGQTNQDDFSDGHGICQTVPFTQEDNPSILYEQRECRTVSETRGHQQSFLIKTEDPTNVPSGHEDLEHELSRSESNDKQQLIIREESEVFATAMSTYRGVDRTTLASDRNDNSCEMSGSSELDDVTLPHSTTPASSVTITTDATGSANSHSSTISGE